MQAGRTDIVTVLQSRIDESEVHSSQKSFETFSLARQMRHSHAARYNECLNDLSTAPEQR